MLIPMGPGQRGRHLGLQIDEKDLEGEMYSSKLRGLRLRAGNVVNTKTGNGLLDKVVGKGEAVIIHLPHKATPQKGHFVISYNPRLLDYGSISAPSIIDCEEVSNGNMFLRFDAKEVVDLKEFKYIFEIYLIE